MVTPLAISPSLLQWHVSPGVLCCNMVKGGRAEGGEQMEEMNLKQVPSLFFNNIPDSVSLILIRT